jgi:hypothetical protein
MTRFRDLLKPDPGSAPKDQQERASKGLADAVAASNLRWWKQQEAIPSQGRCLLLAVAPYSQYDLTLLDLIDELLGSKNLLGAQVYVVNVQDYDSIEQLAADFPGIGQVHQTPVAAVWELGSPKETAWGKKARDMAAEALGIPLAELSRRVKEESPSYANVVRQ